MSIPPATPANIIAFLIVAALLFLLLARCRFKRPL